MKAEEAIERGVFRRKVLKIIGFEDRREKSVCSKQTEESKKRHGENIKEYWRTKKTRNKGLKLGMWSSDDRNKHTDKNIPKGLVVRPVKHVGLHRIYLAFMEK